MWNTGIRTFVVIWCLASAGHAMDPKAPSDMKSPANPHKVPMDNEFKTSGGCTEKVDLCFKMLAASLKKSQPFEIKDVKPCIGCLINELSSIKLVQTEEVRIASCDNGDKPETVYYIFKMVFDKLVADCNECTVDAFPDKVVGAYKGTWPNPMIEVRVHKTEWNGKSITVTQSRVLNKLDPAMVDMKCLGPEAYIKPCEATHKAGGFAGIFYNAASVLFTVKSNERFADSTAESEAKGDDSCMAAMMCCNKDDIDEE